MAFNVLKDPKDPRNFIITPAPAGGADPALLAAGQAAGQAGTIQRPAARAGFGTTAPAAGEAQFGPGSEEAFAQGLFNFRGRLNEKRFNQNKTVFEANLVRDGLNMQQDGLRGALDEAYKSTNGFQAATDVAQDFFFNQPEQKAQRALDLDVQQKKEARDTRKQLAETTRIQNENDIFKFDLGIPPARMASDRKEFSERQIIADRLRDGMVLSRQFGSQRFGEATSSEKAAVKRAYENIVREVTLGVGRLADAGALGDVERDWFGEFAGDFGTLSPIQDSSRRVALADSFNMMHNGAEAIRTSNRGLMVGARPAVWDLGDPRTVDQILARELPPGLTLIPQAEVERIAETQQTRRSLAGDEALGPATAENLAEFQAGRAIEQIDTGAIPGRRDEPAAPAAPGVPAPEAAAPTTSGGEQSEQLFDFFEGIPALLGEGIKTGVEEFGAAAERGKAEAERKRKERQDRAR